jgi:hypothetical protein
MRNEFYGDRKDVWKWSVVLTVAGKQKPIVYVPMLTANDGNLFGVVENAHPDVVAFFEAERKLFQSSPRNVGRIVNLLPGRIRIIGRDFRNACRSKHFQDVASELGRHSEPVVLLVDPDNGLACTKPGKQHIADSELRLLWESLSTGSTLLLFQVSGGRKKDWLNDRMQAFAEALSIGSSAVQSNSNAGVFILEATK